MSDVVFPPLANMAAITEAAWPDRGDKVPAWTPEEEQAFSDRMARISALPSGEALERAFHVRPPATTVTFAVDLSIDRKARATCPECRKRRVLYAIVVGGNAFGGSEPRCARDWGIR